MHRHTNYTHAHTHRKVGSRRRVKNDNYIYLNIYIYI